MADKALAEFVKTRPYVPYDCGIIEHHPESENSASMLDFLLARPSRIRRDWNGREFPDTVYKDLDGGSVNLIRCLVRVGKEWTWKFKPLTL